MRLSCTQCARSFTITAEQLGREGFCPHCRATVRLPSAEDLEEGQEAVVEPRQWWKYSVSSLASVAFHAALVLSLIFVRCDGDQGLGPPEEVLIGVMPSEELSQGQDDELVQEDPEVSEPEELEVTLDIAPAPTTDAPSDEVVAISSPSTTGNAASFSQGALTLGGGGSMSGGNWDGFLKNLQRNGLDIIIAFDSTGSMGGEIRAVKRQIRKLGTTLFQLVPKTRLGICTYRDEGEEYLVRGLPLTNNLQVVEEFLSDVYPGGGGDNPEAVHSGLEWSLSNNSFRRRSRKVILLFGDAPPHQRNQQLCVSLATDFRDQYNGLVSTVTCRARRKMPAFVEIAEAGGGEAFLTTDQREIMTQLMVLVFGGRHRSKVLEAFKLLEIEE
ncbi:MAG TPA: hypothetical protein DCE55_15255 [Planctomycetaceae bacterium]|nr:hypothetical protein [Planctomycetaceae bacterium]|tara:strand:- start:35 stop:1189 length:1155 start_codon:yes stop_codon:yes gene_type:complete